MSNELKKAYEISLWEDIIPKDLNESGFYREQKIAIIGSDTMTSPSRAINPIFKENINGTHELSFTLYTNYFDEYENTFKDNPFIKYMVNERKVKLHYNNRWYDFIIKGIEEDSLSNSFQYTLIDSYINELSKNGFNIELDAKLENNQGTIGELAKSILQGTDWKIGEVDTLVQKNVEALYKLEIIPGHYIKAVDMETLKNEVPTEITIGVPNNETSVKGPMVYLFYSSANDRTTSQQFLYREDGEYLLDEKGIVKNAKNYLLVEGTIPFDGTARIHDWRGNRIVQKEVTKYDQLTDNFVTVYKDNQKNEYYMYTENEYISPLVVGNLIIQNKDFTNTSGWMPSNGNAISSLVYPPISQLGEDSEITSYLKIKYDYWEPVLNTGIKNNLSLLENGIAEGEEFVFRIKYKISENKDGSGLIEDTEDRLRLRLGEYSIKENGVIVVNDNEDCLDFRASGKPIKFIPFNSLTEGGKEDPRAKYKYYRVKAKKGLSHTELNSTTKPIGIFLSLSTNNIVEHESYYYYYVEDVELFRYKKDIKGNLLLPGSVSDSYVKTKYYYYSPKENSEALEKEDVVYKYIGNTKPDDLFLKYDTSFEKIRSITAKESNRFNLIQSLCETFECWVRFEIEHNEDGSIVIDSENGPHKTVYFKEYTGKDNYVGFKYGINLKSIKRTINSEQIVSKIIVKNNSNEFAKNKFCTIARSKENPIKENFLLNFNYYIRHGLLNANEVNNDLYLDVPKSNYLGYYIKLNKINSELDKLDEEFVLIGKQMSDFESTYVVFKNGYDEALQKANELKSQITDYCGVNANSIFDNLSSYQQFTGISTIREWIEQIKTWESTAKNYHQLYDNANANIEKLKVRIETIKKNVSNFMQQKEELNLKFYQKYSKYIQEGSWMSEDYIDDDLYYLDAERILNTSAFPDINYTIDVIELSNIEEYKNYFFDIGDKTYIEDTEFFGYNYIDGVKTPYQEEVILSEITYNLDSPEQNTIKIQNYKTQFEDLFQRINATTQALQYASGSYDRVTSGFAPDGSILPSVIQNSLINNSIIISNATDQSVIQGPNGITITNKANPSEIVRLVSGGILITSDGGDTWSAGVTGAGINANYITSGQIDASKINITTGGVPSFRWDGRGLNAFYWDTKGFNTNTFTRFDRFGFYGVKKYSKDSFDIDLAKAMNIGENAKEEERIKAGLNFIEENGKFGFTWDGFFLKSDKADGGRIEFSSGNDLIISSLKEVKKTIEEDGVKKEITEKERVERIKIGTLEKIKEGEYRYGLRIKDVEGNSVLETNDTGSLWLTDSLVIGPSKMIDNERYYDYRAQLGIINTWKFTDEGGPLTDTTKSGAYSKIFSVKNENNEETISIYDTGKLIANDVEINGGRIGNMTIDSITDNLSGISIEAIDGFVIKKKINGELDKNEYKFKAIVKNLTGGIKWEYSRDNEKYAIINGQNNEILTLSGSTLNSYFGGYEMLYLKVTVGNREQTTVLTLLKEVNIDVDGLDLELDTYNINLSYPEISKFVDNDGSITLSPLSLTLNTTKGYDEKLNNNEISYDFYLYSESQNRYNEPNSSNWFKLNKEYKRLEYETIQQEDGSIEVVVEKDIVENLFQQYITLINDNEIKLDIETFITDSKKEENNKSYFYQEVSDILINENTVIRIEVIKNEKIIANNSCRVVFGTSQDMATFRLTAANIQMAVTQSNLTFDSKGLHIVNGGFDIYKDNNDGIDPVPLLRIEDDGNLYVNGTGEFSGKIIATSGEFTGTVTAQEGSLGNLDINGTLFLGEKGFTENEEDKGIYISGSNDDNALKGIYSSSYIKNNNEGFIIKEDGTIIANQLTLGAGANISKYIKLGNAWITNPEWVNNNISDSIVTENKIKQDSVFIVKDENSNDLVNIRQDGIMYIGNENPILIDGNNGSIKSNNYSNNKGWSIGQNEARFNNIVASGSIKSSVIEYSQSSVQAIGGIMLVKPSSIIKAVRKIESTHEKTSEEIELTLESQMRVNDSDYIKIGNSSTKDIVFKTKANDNTNIVTILMDAEDNLLNNLDELVGAPLINMGSRNSGSIVINGSESPNSVYSPTALSIFENNIKRDSTNGEEDKYESLHPETKLVLGQMPQNIKDKTYGLFDNTSYGLYGENVFVKGAIISEGMKNGKSIYSGMNTNSNIPYKNEDAAYFGGLENTGNIILWAGAEQIESTDGTKISNTIDIQNARFKVDNFGNLYANSGYFVGTIITDATITASKIMTAELEGIQKFDEDGKAIDTPALTISNSKIGINFVKNSNSNNRESILLLKDDVMNLNADFKVGNSFLVEDNSTLNTSLAFFKDFGRKNQEGTVVIDNPIMSVISPNKIGFVKNENIEDKNNINYKGYISWEGVEKKEGEQEISIGSVSIYEGGSKIATFGNNESTFSKNVRMGGQLLSFYGNDGQDKIQLKTVNVDGNVVGYDLYLL